MRMHLKWNLAERYLESEGHAMGESTWYRWKQRLTKETLERLYEVAQYEFPEQHLEAIEEIKAGRKKMWDNIAKIKDPFKQNIAIQNLLNLLPLSSQYYDATKGVIEKPESKEDNSVQKQESEQQQQPNEWV
jgi:hypothetical protein